MTDSVSPALDDAEREIRRIAQEAFDELVQRIRAGEVSRDVIAEIQARFGDQYKGALASAFTVVLGRSISSGQVAALSLGKVSLSRRLYENSVEVSSQVRQTIERHSAGMRDARKLALDIFEGYGFKGGQDPLKVRAGLPKYLKELLADRELGAPLEQLYRRINASVARTQPLKAAYLQAVDSVLDQFGGLRLEKALKVAQFERNRYFANRIAQTELHRAHTDRMASEILADGDLEVVQLVLSSTHPRTDICDMHARVDKFGLGPGCYPKALAPKPPFHPFCRCLLRKRFDLSATGARERGGAERAFLRDHPDPARVMGSRAKAQTVLGGVSVEKVLNDGKDPLYHFRTLGAPVRGTTPSATSELQTAPASTVPAPASIPRTVDDFILEGRAIAERLGVIPGADAKIAQESVLRALNKEVGTSTPVKVMSKGANAGLVKEASKRYPDSWTSAADSFGRLFVSGSSKAGNRGFCYGDLPPGTWKLREFGVVQAQNHDGFVFVRTGEIGNAVHELGHRLQSALPGLDKLFSELHNRRTAGAPLEQLRALFPGSAYSASEVTRKDHYFDAYQGREYNGKPLEMFTMAFEGVLGDSARLADMLARDPEMVEFTIGLLFKWKP